MKKSVYLLLALLGFSNLSLAITSGESAAIMSKCRMHHTQGQCNKMLQNMVANHRSESENLSHLSVN